MPVESMLRRKERGAAHHLLVALFGFDGRKEADSAQNLLTKSDQVLITE